MRTIGLLGFATLAAATLPPTIAAATPRHMTGSERNAVLAAGCTIHPYPNPTGKAMPRPPTVHCSPAARVALQQARQVGSERLIADEPEGTTSVAGE